VSGKRELLEKPIFYSTESSLYPKWLTDFLPIDFTFVLPMLLGTIYNNDFLAWEAIPV